MVSPRIKGRLLETTAPSRPHGKSAPTLTPGSKVAAKVTSKQAAPPTAISDDARAALGRQWRRARPPKTAPPDEDDDDDVDAMSIRLFCKRHGISPSFFHYLIKVGKGPRTMKLGQRTLITSEAARDWRLEREAETMASSRQPAAAASTTA